MAAAAAVYRPQLSRRALLHVQGPFKVLFKRLGPDMIALASGMPPGSMFPIVDLSVKVKEERRAESKAMKASSQRRKEERLGE